MICVGSLHSEQAVISAHKTAQAAPGSFVVEQESWEGLQSPGVTVSLLSSAWQLQLFLCVLFPPRQLQLEVMGMHSAMTNLV